MSIVVYVVGAVVVIGALLLVAAYLDRRRGRSLENDLSRLDVDPRHEPLHEPDEVRPARGRTPR